MLEVNKKVAQKFGIDTKLIEEKAKPEKYRNFVGRSDFFRCQRI